MITSVQRFSNQSLIEPASQGLSRLHMRGRLFSRLIQKALNFRVAVLMVTVLCCCQWQMSVADEESASETYDRARLVILAPKGPVLAELRISVAGLPYRQWVGRYLAQQLDQDRSGTLSATELDLLTPQIRQLVSLNSIDEITAELAGDTQPPQVSSDHFAAWMRTRLPKSFFISAVPKSPDSAVRLSSLLDTNLDGVVSAEELRQAAHTLRFRDLDDDQTYSISELLPYRDPRTQETNLTPDAASLPFLEVTDTRSADQAAEKLLRRYGDERQIPYSRLRLPDSPDEFPEELSHAKLSQLLLSDSSHVVLEFRLSDKANRSDVICTVVKNRHDVCQLASKTFGSCRLIIDEMPMQLVARGGGANNRAYMKGFLGQNFLMADTDKNQYLDEAEFAEFSAYLRQSDVTAEFASVDRNQDQMITRDELFGYFDRETIAAASRIEVTVEQDGKTMFGLLDTNMDRRLSQREIQNAVTVLQPYDLSSDGRYSDDELGIEYNLTIGLGRTEVRRNTVMNMTRSQQGMMNSGDAILPAQDARTGPEWFHRMDRNQDGDVSRREFLGTPAMFAELDQNGDQLIDAEEAAAVTTEFVAAESATPDNSVQE